MEKECCDNCEHCEFQRGYGIGNFDYWCRKQNGQKHKDYYCDLYEEQE